jgi:ribosome maturation factor RimP
LLAFFVNRFVDCLFLMTWQQAVERTVTGLKYDLVDCERSSQGLLRVFIDRRAGEHYASPGEFITVEDCEAVTRQLQYVLEVEGCDYRRLEVSSPGVDRPLRSAADYARFAGSEIDLVLKQPLEGRKKYRGALRAAGAAFELVFHDKGEDKVLGFSLDEVREARLVPVLNFKGRGASAPPLAAPAKKPAGHANKRQRGAAGRAAGGPEQ